MGRATGCDRMGHGAGQRRARWSRRCARATCCSYGTEPGCVRPTSCVVELPGGRPLGVKRAVSGSTATAGGSRGTRRQSARTAARLGPLPDVGGAGPGGAALLAAAAQAVVERQALLVRRQQALVGLPPATSGPRGPWRTAAARRPAARRCRAPGRAGGSRTRGSARTAR